MKFSNFSTQAVLNSSPHERTLLGLSLHLNPCQCKKRLVAVVVKPGVHLNPVVARTYSVMTIFTTSIAIIVATMTIITTMNTITMSTTLTIGKHSHSVEYFCYSVFLVAVNDFPCLADRVLSFIRCDAFIHMAFSLVRSMALSFVPYLFSSLCYFSMDVVLSLLLHVTPTSCTCFVHYLFRSFVASAVLMCLVISVFMLLFCPSFRTLFLSPFFRCFFRSFFLAFVLSLSPVSGAEEHLRQSTSRIRKLPGSSKVSLS